MEIQRLIGRSLRAVMDLGKLGDRTLTIDCDVIQADGGTRTASITGGYVAMADAVGWLMKEGLIRESPLSGQVASVSTGVCKGTPILDLDYDEDSQAETDMNFVLNQDGDFIEVQGTAEGRPFTREQMLEMMDLARQGIAQLIRIQSEVLTG
jgi:ribonuclease PH